MARNELKIINNCYCISIDLLKLINKCYLKKVILLNYSFD